VDGAPSFGVCFVSDADVLPLPTPVFNDKGTSTTGAATIVDVGTGAAPASCEDARVFGARGTSDWWFQAKAANNRVWTIGVRGLGNVPLVHKTDAVTLNLNWRGYGPGVGVGNPYGELQLQDAADAPLLWASSDKNTTSWVALAAGPAECDVTAVCNGDRHAVLANVNGSTATVPSFGSAYLSGFFLAVGQSVNSLGMLPGQCPDYYPPPFEAAAAKVPVSGP
jgi:hypothetical protein